MRYKVIDPIEYEVPVAVTLLGKVKVKVYPDELDEGESLGDVAKRLAEDEANDGWCLKDFAIDEASSGDPKRLSRDEHD